MLELQVTFLLVFILYFIDVWKAVSEDPGKAERRTIFLTILRAYFLLIVLYF